jgi:hypothetical protein
MTIMRTNGCSILAGLAAIAVAAMMGGGCGVTGGASHSHGRGNDVRSMARMNATTGPKVVVAGPARLLHVDIHGERAFAIYAVARQTGTDADCLAAPAAPAVAVARANRHRPLGIAVPAGQVICLANSADAPDKRGAEVSWHARRGAPQPGVRYADNH